MHLEVSTHRWASLPVRSKYEWQVTTYEYEQINTDPAIWARDKDNIADEEYQEFWQVVAKGDGGQKAEDWTHFTAE
jgi:heat shock protein beta